MPLFALTTFLSAFLLFQVQPLMGRYILPWFGGGPAVWTACMLFFQVLLLAGYAYAHGISWWLNRRWQGAIHALLLAASLLFLPIRPDAEVWRTVSESSPVGIILFLLLVNVGMPYFLLSSTAPLLQRWFAWIWPGRSPYRLYALSNTGSLLALLSYPFFVEPNFILDHQVTGWAGGYAAFALLCILCAVYRLSGNHVAVSRSPETKPGDAGSGFREEVDTPDRGTVLTWLSLSTLGSAILLAVTNQVCQQVAVVPFLWVAPLALYLLTFMICFDREKWYVRHWWGYMLVVMIPGGWICSSMGPLVPLWLQVPIFLAALFTCCMACHGELVRARPPARHLTLFYLMISLGGALGGVFVALVAPQIFSDYREFEMILVGCGVAVLLAWMRDRLWVEQCRHFGFFQGSLGGYVGALVLVWLLMPLDISGEGKIVYQDRNFYGSISVREGADNNGPNRHLVHGQVIHGIQYLDGGKLHWPTTYYGRESGVGVFIEFHPKRTSGQGSSGGLRIGVVGQGAGTISAFLRGEDYLRYYEINPSVSAAAERFFSFPPDPKARIDVAIGDGRILLEQELMQNGGNGFDILAVDAFNGDAIPIHLLTRECFDLYLKHLDPRGVLLLHISNRFLDLSPVVRGLAEEFDYQVFRLYSRMNKEKGTYPAQWMAVTKNREIVEVPAIQEKISPPPEKDKPSIVWTDDFASLWQVLKR